MQKKTRKSILESYWAFSVLAVLFLIIVFLVIPITLIVLGVAEDKAFLVSIGCGIFSVVAIFIANRVHTKRKKRKQQN